MFSYRGDSNASGHTWPLKRAKSFEELEEILSDGQIGNLLRGNLEIRLVIIDSLAFPFRYRMVDDSTSSGRLLNLTLSRTKPKC